MNGSYKLLTGMSHEIRGHMNSIVGLTYLMEKTCPDNHENNEYGTLLLNSCNQLISLFQNYLDSAMIETTSNNVDYKRCSINSIIEKSYSEFTDVMTSENKKGVTLLCEENTDKSEILIDYPRVNRVLHSLLQNSLKHTLSGYIRIGYYIKGKDITFYVIDTGQDYNKTREFLHSGDMDKSLTKFFDTNTAINIIVAQKIINILGGKIWIEPNDSSGTGVYFSVPYKEQETKETLSLELIPGQFHEDEFHIQSRN